MPKPSIYSIREEREQRERKGSPEHHFTPYGKAHTANMRVGRLFLRLFEVCFASWDVEGMVLDIELLVSTAGLVSAELTLQQCPFGDTEERYHQPIDRSRLTPATRLQSRNIGHTYVASAADAVGYIRSMSTFQNFRAAYPLRADQFLHDYQHRLDSALRKGRGSRVVWVSDCGLLCHRNESLYKKNAILFLNGKHFPNNRVKALPIAKNYASDCILPTNKLSGPYFAGTPVKCLNQEDDQLLNDRFTYNELLKDMEETKKGKSAGPDDFTAEPFFNLSKKAKLALLHFYYIIWKTSVPSEWRKSGILPIIKPH
ncbi:uncharacterized protein TNCV_2354981 [Trichonephila clavipes]|nr:uncharacterized protein TNCV_2354981 [Trichonephila clavipes]